MQWGRLLATRSTSRCGRDTPNGLSGQVQPDHRAPLSHCYQDQSRIPFCLASVSQIADCSISTSNQSEYSGFRSRPLRLVCHRLLTPAFGVVDRCFPDMWSPVRIAYLHPVRQIWRRRQKVGNCSTHSRHVLVGKIPTGGAIRRFLRPLSGIIMGRHAMRTDGLNRKT